MGHDGDIRHGRKQRMISDQPDIKLAVLEGELQDIAPSLIDIHINIVRGWLVKRIEELKEDVKAMKTRQAQAHTVDEALLDKPYDLRNNKSYVGWMADEDDFTKEGC